MKSLMNAKFEMITTYKIIEHVYRLHGKKLRRFINLEFLHFFVQVIIFEIA